MNSEPNSYRRTVQLNKPVENKFFKITRNKKDKNYLLFNNENKLILHCKFENKVYNIYDIESKKIAVIHKVGYRFYNNTLHKMYYLYYNKKENSQILGIHQCIKKNYNQFSIPHVYEYNHGFNSFRDLDHMYLTDNTNKRRIILESIEFNESAKFDDYVNSIKNSQYYIKNNLKFELIKDSTNNFNLYLDNPLSLIQGFMLALVNLRI